MKDPELSETEMDEVLNLIQYSFGYNFTCYSRSSMQRRLQRFMVDAAANNAFDLKHYLVNTAGGFDYFLSRLTVNVTEMFRDPAFFRNIKEKVLPVLASYPTIKLWHAGCATGEEVFSMAILLHEAGLLQRTRIYATDINPVNIDKAKQGILPLHVMKEYTANYINAGGTNDFSTYYTARYNNVIINKELRKNILFSQHNLVTDGGFNEFQLICCRNVLIYFNRELQNRVIGLLHESLSKLGFLALGTKESLILSTFQNHFQPVDQVQKIFRRVS